MPRPVLKLPKGFELTKDQAKAIELIQDFLEDPSASMFVLGGAAGTGKTTVLKLIYQMYKYMGLCAYTGKATNNLNLKIGNNVATTLHRKVYKLEGEKLDPRTKRTMPTFSRKVLNLEGQTVGVDEFSLINDVDGQTLEETNAKLFVVGDEFQIKPVEGEKWIKKLNFRLKQITRQAEDSGLIRQLHSIRYDRLPLEEDDGIRIVDKLTDDHLMESDIILCYRNPRRHEFNRRMRRLHGYPDHFARQGENVVALVNNYELNLYNGSVYKLARDYDLNTCGGPIYLEIDSGNVIEVPKTVFVPDNCDIYHFSRKERLNYDCMFDFGYCLTVHKSQGSEWRQPAMLDDYNRGSDYLSWLYTGVSRAIDSLIYQLV